MWVGFSAGASPTPPFTTQLGTLYIIGIEPEWKLHLIPHSHNHQSAVIALGSPTMYRILITYIFNHIG
jgi:hypothetical protein